MYRKLIFLRWVGLGLLLIGLAAPVGVVSASQPRPDSVVIMGVPVSLPAEQMDAAVKIARRVPSELDKAPLNEATIIALAKYFHLFKTPAPNKHLGMLGGDISYWAGQVRQGYLDRDRLLAEFASRMIVLEAAAERKIYIPSQGDLSAVAQPLVGYFLNQLP